MSVYSGNTVILQLKLDNKFKNDYLTNVPQQNLALPNGLGLTHSLGRSSSFLSEPSLKGAPLFGEWREAPASGVLQPASVEAAGNVVLS